MKYTVKLNDTKYVVEIENSTATILDKLKEQGKVETNIEQDDYYDIPDFDFSDDAAAGSNTVVSKLPGTVIKIIAEAGKAVKKGDALMVIESMKMENEIIAEHDCTVQSVLVKVGDYIKKEQPLLTTD